MMAPEARAAAGAGATPLRLKLRAAASSLAWWGWSLILVGIPLGNTTVGLAVLVAAALARLAGGGRAPCSPFARDAFYRWGWVFLAITVLSAVTSPRPHLGLATSLAFFLMFSLIACGSRMLLEPKVRQRLERLFPVALASGAIGSMYALYTHWVLGRPRAYGVSVSENGLGTVSAFTALVALAFAVRAWRRNLLFHAWLGLVTAVLSLAALLYSLSRGAWLGFGLSVALLILLQVIRGEVRWSKVVLACLLCFVLLGVVLPEAAPRVQRRMLSAFDLDRHQGRLWIWEASVRMIVANPLLGVGGGGFPFEYETYRPEPDRRDSVSFAHNIVLQIAAEFGLLGLAPFLVLIGTAIVRGWRAARRGGILVQALYCGFLGILAHEMVDNVTYGMNVGGLFWLLAGLMAHLGRPGGTSRTC